MATTWIFDFDDTLIMTHQDYTLGEIDFFKWMHDRLDHKMPDLQETLEICTKINLANVERYGFTVKRFLRSLEDTFLEICDKSGVIPTKKDIDTIYQIGKNATFNESKIRSRGFVPGARKVLNFLMDKNDDLAILTKGDLEWQKKKLELLGCKIWFGQHMYIAEKKTVEDIKMVARLLPNDHIFMIGNSIRSDILPAIEAGLRTVLIPCYTWAYEKDHGGIPKGSNTVIFENIIEIRENYNRLIAPELKIS